MLSPEYLRRITEGSEQIAEELHQYIISEIVSRMVARIGRGEDYILTNADAWIAAGGADQTRKRQPMAKRPS